MAALRTTRVRALWVVPCTVAAAALISGAGAANADPNDPALPEVAADGQIRSEPSARIQAGEVCVPNLGTLATSQVRTFEQGVPNQIIEESGPEWVGSDGLFAVGLAPANPFGGNFDSQNAATGRACGPVIANGF